MDENAEFVVAELLLGSHHRRRRHITLDTFVHIGKDRVLGKAQKGR
jgi:hypothetical protein